MYTIKQNPSEKIVSLNLSQYIKKPEAATKEELKELKAELDTKLTELPQHKHDTGDIDGLAEALNEKLNIGLYSYRTLINDTELIDFLQHPKIVINEITKDKLSNGYKFKVDNNNNLIIQDSNDKAIMWYNNALGRWIIGETDINDFINITNETLLNHAEVIKQIAKEVGIPIN